MDAGEQRTFKQLTPDNWAEPDPVMRHFSRIPKEGLPRQATADDWVLSFLRLELTEAVPRNVRDLFEVARGVCLYGWFFYPLYQIGEDQLFRVVDAAVGAKCEQAGGPKARTSFAARIDWLLKQGMILEEERIRWDALRNLRNFASHPEMQMIHPPGSVLMSFQLAVLQINALFEQASIEQASSVSPAKEL
jgi:hypothetical protein